MSYCLLLIEPDRVLAETYCRAFEAADFRVNVTADAQTAIAAVDSEQPDAILLELQLAGHNGVEFLYELRSYPDWQSIPVVVLSAVPTYALSASVRARLAIAAVYYKPETSLEQLTSGLRRLLTTAGRTAS